METVPTVECAKCGHLNPQDERKCEECGHHLYVTCPECGQLVLRVARRGHRLWVHREAGTVPPRRSFASQGRDLLVALAAFASVGLMIFGLLVWMGVVEPLFKQLAENGSVDILGRPTGPSGIAKLAFLLGAILLMGLVALVSGRTVERGHK